jgi:carboxymethylenebutenolidase
MRDTAIAVVLLACLIVGCEDGAGDTGEEPAVAEEGRIAQDPTPPDSLPPAVLGAGPAPGGVPVHYFDEDSATTGYLALPAGDGPFPGVILIHEWDGLVDRIRQVADALAAEGYAALAADVYSGRTGSNAEENLALVNETVVDSARLVRNLDAAARYLREHPATTGRIATIGWCFGGGIALSYALGGETHEGTAMFYGRIITDPERLDALDHELYGTFAGNDRDIPADEVDRFVGALREAGVENDVHIYDDVEHGFWLYVDRDPARNREPARDAWQRLKAYLVRTIR